MDPTTFIANDAVALAFYAEYAQYLRDKGFLEKEDEPSFVLLCKLWSKLNSSTSNGRDFNDLVTKWNSISKQFGLFPAERRRLSMSLGQTKLDNKEEFKL